MQPKRISRMFRQLIRAFEWALKMICMSLIHGYRLLLSPVLGGQCRFHPTCSRYALSAFKQHRPIRAIGLTLHRIWRCQPFSSGGDDPVPSSTKVRVS